MSIIYDGGGTNEALMKDTTMTNVIAGIVDGAVNVANATFVDIQLVNAAAGESATLNVYEFSAATPTVASLIRVRQVVFPTTDLTVTGDLLMLGNSLTTATAYLKAARRVPLLHTSRSMLVGIDAESATGAKYLRYEIGTGNVDGDAEMTVSNLDLDIGNVGLLNAADGRVDPSEGQAANTAYAAADKVTPSGAVRVVATDTLPEEVADRDWTPLQTDATGKLRTRDDDLLTEVGAIGDAVDIDGSVQAKLRAIATVDGAIADAIVNAGSAGSISAKIRRLTSDLNALNALVGATDTAVVDAGSAGNLSAKLRRLTTDLGSIVTLLAVGTGVMESAQAVTLATDDTVMGATDATLVDAGAAGSISSKLRRLTQDLGSLVDLLAVGSGIMTSAHVVTLATDDTVIGPTNASAVDGDSEGSISAKLRGINKAFYQLDTDIGYIDAAVGNRDEVLYSMYRITVDSGTDIFANQGGAALPATTTSIALIPEDDTVEIRMALGDASSSTPRLPATGIVIPITKAVGDTIEMWISSGTEYVTLLVYVPR